MLRNWAKGAWRILDRLPLGFAQRVLTSAHKKWSRGRVSSWRPHSRIEETVETSNPKQKEVGVFIHVYYEDYLPRLNKVIAEFEEHLPHVEFFFASPKEDIVQALQNTKTRNSNVSKVVLSENRGRNFGPLFVEFPMEIREFDFMVHVHTKKSLHQRTEYAKEWSDLLWNNLLENRDVFLENLEAMRGNLQAQLLYPVDLELQHPTCYGWKQARIQEIPDLDDELFLIREEGRRFPFPIGGMFMARSTWLNSVFLRRKWSYADFPEEKGQIDLTTQHMIERLLGVAKTSVESNLTQIAFFPGLNLRTTDTSFVYSDQKSSQTTKPF